MTWELISLFLIIIQLFFFLFAIMAIVEGSQNHDKIKMTLGMIGLVIPVIGIIAFLIHKNSKK